MPNTQCDVEIEITGRVYRGHMFNDYYALCKTHETKSGPWHSSSAAFHNFRCDPSNRKFLIVQLDRSRNSENELVKEYDHSMEDLSGLTQLIHDVYEDTTYGFGNYPEMRYYQLVSDEAITTLIPLGMRSTDEGFDSNDYAYPEVTVYRTDTNETVTEFGIKIDGRV